jgi:hypothetical protein
MRHLVSNRILSVLATATLAGSGIVAMSGGAAAEPRAACATPYATNGIVTDFDDDGTADVVASAPGAHHGAGEVRVSYGNGEHETLRVIVADTPMTSVKGDHYGAALAAGDLDGNRCTDLVVGIPGLTVDGVSGAGGVQVLYGDGSRAFAPGPLLTRATPGIPGDPSHDEHFGAAPATPSPTPDRSSTRSSAARMAARCSRRRSHGRAAVCPASPSQGPIWALSSRTG